MSSDYNWESLAATGIATAVAVLAVVWPGVTVPPAVQGTLIGIAGILALFHVHVPTVIAKILAPTSSQDLAKAREALAVAAKALEGTLRDD